jgi:hypothetical protein
MIDVFYSLQKILQFKFFAEVVTEIYFATKLGVIVKLWLIIANQKKLMMIY